MYSLILKSKKKETKSIFDWITHEVMPSLRKYGEYKLNHSLKKQIDIINKKIDDLEEIINTKDNEIEVLKHNLKIPKYQKDTIVYILRLIEDNINFDKNKTYFLKFGKTKNMKARVSNYITASKNRVHVIKTIKVNDLKIIKDCVIKKMENYKIKDRKEYFECIYNEIIKEIASCINFFENRYINLEPRSSRNF